MKTNIVMKSSDRELFGITIKQQTKNRFVSVTDLMLAYERGRFQYGWNDRRIADILNSESTTERIFHLLNERGFIKTGFPAFTEMVEREGIVKVLKGLGVWSMTGRGENRSVYADPYIWVLLAMELNPLLYAKVVIWITDTLIFDRIEAGSEYMPMNAAIKSITENPDYPKYARAINERVFGKHQTGIRQLASAKQLKMISDIEKYVTKAIDMQHITTEAQVMTAIEKF